MKVCKHLLALCIYVPLLAQAQTIGNGIQWTKGKSFEEIRKQAEQENKYIFLDCYTTWCGPCKMMDKSTYVDESVGNYFNDKFISVKVQMDRTDKDDAATIRWYDAADSISKAYHVEGYPCFVFLSPHGDLVHKAMGFRPASEFIDIGKTAVIPGKVYDDEYAKYDIFVQAYKAGQRDFNSYPGMVKIAFKANDTAIGYQLMRDLSGFMDRLPKKNRYTKERIEMWASFGLPSKSKVFQFFYRDGQIIDRVIGHKGFAAETIDRTIQNEICLPFMEKHSNGYAMRGAYLTGRREKTDSLEADWNELYAMVKKKYGALRANRAVLTARIEWYRRLRNHIAFVKYSVQHLKKFPPDFIEVSTALRINDICWSAFVHSTNKKIITACIPWMKKIVKQNPQVAEFADTYANLLYKAGRKEQAVEWEKKAITLAPEEKLFQEALGNMNQDRPTHVKLGAIWD